MSNQQGGIDRRRFLGRSVGASAGLIAGPTSLTWLAGPAPASAAPAQTTTGATGLSTVASGGPAFVDDYLTNSLDNLSAETNAAVRILSGMAKLWTTGATWNDGVARQPDLLRENIRYVVEVTQARTDAEAKLSFLHDRQHQSYSAIAGLGPLAGLYRAGAKAVTSITGAPDGTPPGRISDGVPPDAPAGSATGAGSVDSELGKVVELVNTIRGPHASSNPSKLTFQYPRPWRLTDDSEVVETGGMPVLGVPIYDSDVSVAPQLLRQRGGDPANDGGYPSGHANAAYLAALALAYAVPERFQELLARASEVSHSRIISGMHSPVDVIGGRILATALAAAVLHDPAYAQLKQAARRQALEYFLARTGTTADTLYAYAHSAGPDTDRYADRRTNRETTTPRLTYTLPRRGPATPMTVPKGAEVLLETRLPYLDAAQRREVLRTTALPSGYPLLDGPEQWGRLNLFAAADGYGSFHAQVRVTMDAAAGGFGAADTWRNDIGGTGGLVKAGTGALTLAGDNSYTGGTGVEGGTLVAASPRALGRGDVQVRGGTLRLAPANGRVTVRGAFRQSSGAALEVTLHDDGDAALEVGRTATVEPGGTLRIHLDPQRAPALDETLPVIRCRRLRGRFSTVAVTVDGIVAVPVYTAAGLSVRLTPAGG